MLHYKKQQTWPNAPVCNNWTAFAYRLASLNAVDWRSPQKHNHRICCSQERYQFPISALGWKQKTSCAHGSNNLDFAQLISARLFSSCGQKMWNMRLRQSSACSHGCCSFLLCAVYTVASLEPPGNSPNLCECCCALAAQTNPLAFSWSRMADPPTSALPPTSDSRMQKKSKKLSKLGKIQLNTLNFPYLGMGSMPTDIFIRSLRAYVSFIN